MIRIKKSFYTELKHPRDKQIDLNLKNFETGKAVVEIRSFHLNYLLQQKTTQRTYSNT